MIENLPKELLRELRLNKFLPILDLPENTIINLDQALIHWYKKTGIVKKRNTMNSLLYRLAQAGYFVSLKGKKGHYRRTDKICSN